MVYKFKNNEYGQNLIHRILRHSIERRGDC